MGQMTGFNSWQIYEMFFLFWGLHPVASVTITFGGAIMGPKHVGGTKQKKN
jgi:hypothetical protein